MSATPETNKNSWFFILGIIFGMITLWIMTESVLWVFLGAVMGLLFAAFFVSVLVEGREN